VLRRALSLVLIGLLVPGAASAATPEQVARAIERDPVYSAPGAEPGLTQEEAGKIRIRIVERDIGRIKVAVVSEDDAAKAGSVKGFANAVDHNIHLHGTLLVFAGDIHMVTSYPSLDRTVEAVREAANATEGEGLGDQLLQIVTAIADVDPGPSADSGSDDGGSINDPEIGKETHRFLGAVKIAVLLVALAIAAPFVIGAVWILLWIRRRRVAERDTMVADHEAVRDGLVALGDQIRELDLDESMPDADPEGRAAYEKALADYESADRAMAGRPTRTKLDEAGRALAAGRAAMEKAEQLFDRQEQAKTGR
jgi:hypothetical protein